MGLKIFLVLVIFKEILDCGFFSIFPIITGLMFHFEVNLLIHLFLDIGKVLIIQLILFLVKLMSFYNISCYFIFISFCALFNFLFYFFYFICI